MPKIDECIIAKGEAGLINKKRATEAATKYREDVDDVVGDGELSVTEAEKIIGQRFLSDQDRAVELRKSNAIRSAAIQKDIANSVTDHVARGIEADVVTRGRLTFDPSSRYTGVSMENRIRTVTGLAHRRYSSSLEKFRTKWAGLTGRTSSNEEIEIVIRELFGENTGNPLAKKLAAEIEDTMEFLRSRFNAAGGDVAKRQNYGLHQSHNQATVLATNKDDWIGYTLKLLDRKKMLGPSGKRMSDRQLQKALNEAYDSIATGGGNDLAKPRGPSTFGSSVNRRANQRFLVFKDGKSWMKYNERFGTGDLQDHILSTISKYSRDIGELEVLGPHSEATIRFMQQVEDDAFQRGALSKEGNKARKLANKVGKDLNSLRSLYGIVTGRAATPARESVAKIGASARNLLMANQLGSAFLVAVSDLATASMTAKMNGMSATRTLSQIFRTFATNQTADRELALQLGFGAQGWASHAIGAQRFVGDLSTGHAITEKAADVVLRASLLSPLTEAGRYGFQIEMAGFITRQMGKGYNKLPKMLRESMKRYDIQEADWEIMRNTPAWEADNGAKFLRAEDIYDDTFSGPKFDAANKMQQMILTEQQFAIVSSTSRVKQLMGEGTFKPGSLWGEIIKSVGMYKSFPMSIMHTHWQRAVYNSDARIKWGYLPVMGVAMTGVAAIGLQAKQISQGRDPRNMYDPGFWGESFLAGGSGGILADTLFQNQSGGGRSITELLAGPVFGTVSDIQDLTIGNIRSFLEGEDTTVGKDLLRFGEGLMPGRTIWYARLLQERLFYDLVEKLADPEAQKSWKRMEKRAKDDFDQNFYWRPGRAKPSRSPDLGAI